MSLIVKNSTSSTNTENDPRWQSVMLRDISADGSFLYAVKTTEIYCRPSCPSRTAKPNHVIFFSDAAEAQAAGFRACQRCRPDGRSLTESQTKLVAQACRLIEAADNIPNLDTLAASASISPYYFHRIFKSITGLTPKAYGIAHRAKRMQEALSEPRSSITQAIYHAGFNSSSRFYENSNEILGMTPTSYKQGGKDTDIHFAIGQCSLGAILVAKSDVGVCAIMLGDDPDHLVKEIQDRFPNANLVGDDKNYEQLIAQVVGYIEDPHSNFDLPLDIQGTAFQQRVWQALRNIPLGKTISYSELAQQIDAPKAVRAVASACGANKLAVVIPCHRVVRNDGALSGYRWGVERKRTLLERERDTSTFKLT